MGDLTQNSPEVRRKAYRAPRSRPQPALCPGGTCIPSLSHITGNPLKHICSTSSRIPNLPLGERSFMRLSGICQAVVSSLGKSRELPPANPVPFPYAGAGMMLWWERCWFSPETMHGAALPGWEVCVGWAGAILTPACTPQCWDTQRGGNLWERVLKLLGKSTACEHRAF